MFEYTPKEVSERDMASARLRIDKLTLEGVKFDLLDFAGRKFLLIESETYLENPQDRDRVREMAHVIAATIEAQLSR